MAKTVIIISAECSRLDVLRTEGILIIECKLMGNFKKAEEG